VQAQKGSTGCCGGVVPLRPRMLAVKGDSVEGLELAGRCAAKVVLSTLKQFSIESATSVALQISVGSNTFRSTSCLTGNLLRSSRYYCLR
jgi:hypothetical protein